MHISAAGPPHLLTGLPLVGCEGGPPLRGSHDEVAPGMLDRSAVRRTGREEHGDELNLAFILTMPSTVKLAKSE